MRYLANSRCFLIAGEETCNRPDRVELRFAVDQVFEFSRYFEMRNDAAQCLRRDVRHGHDMRRVQLHGSTVTWTAPGAPCPPTERSARSTSANHKLCVATLCRGNRP